MAEIMLGLIWDYRDGNCVLTWHQSDRISHDASPMTRWTTWPDLLLCHESTMSWLTVEHPEVHGFSVRIGRQNLLGRIPVDDRESRPLRRLSTKTPRYQEAEKVSAWEMKLWWGLTFEYCSRYLRQLRNMTGQRDTDFSHPDRQLMETSWLNYFSPEHGELVSLSTPAEIPEVAKDLLGGY